MRKIALPLGLSTLVLASAASAAFGQAFPTSQPKFLNIVIERVKTGRAGEHARHEAGWPAAYEKSKSPQAYVALASMTGTPEVWYINPFESHGAFEENARREEADAVLTAELDRLQRADAEFLTEIQTLQAAARPDLSHGAFPDIANVRYYEITVFHIKPGHESAFAGVAKAYATAAAKVAPKASWRTYQVMAGAPSGTFILLSSFQSLAELDQALADGEGMMKTFSADEVIASQKFDAEGQTGPPMTNRYRLDPGQTYVARSVREKDPAFWMPKPAVNAKVLAKKPAQP